MKTEILRNGRSPGDFVTPFLEYNLLVLPKHRRWWEHAVLPGATIILQEFHEITMLP